MPFVFALINIACVAIGVVVGNCLNRKRGWSVSSSSYTGIAINLLLMALCAWLGDVPFVLFYPLKPLSAQVIAVFFPAVAAVLLLLAAATVLLKGRLSSRNDRA